MRASSQAKASEAEKATSLGWFRLDALPEPMVPHEAYALANLSSGVGYLAFGWDDRPSGGGPGRTAGAGSSA